MRRFTFGVLAACITFTIAAPAAAAPEPAGTYTWAEVRATAEVEYLHNLATGLAGLNIPTVIKIDQGATQSRTFEQDSNGNIRVMTRKTSDAGRVSILLVNKSANRQCSRFTSPLLPNTPNADARATWSCGPLTSETKALLTDIRRATGPINWLTTIRKHVPNGSYDLETTTETTTVVTAFTKAGKQDSTLTFITQGLGYTVTVADADTTAPRAFVSVDHNVSPTLPTWMPITCVKGKATKEVTSVFNSCPTGYTKR